MRLKHLLLLSVIAVALNACTQDAANQLPERSQLESTLRVGMKYENAKQVASSHGFEPVPFRGAYQPSTERRFAFEISLPNDRALIVWHAKDGDTVTGIRLVEHASQPKAHRGNYDLQHFDLSDIATKDSR